MDEFELETWVIEVGGDVIEKEASQGRAALTSREKLIHCLWVADYGMRNAGDLETAADLYANFQTEAAKLAGELGLNQTLDAFNLPANALQERNFDLLGGIVAEIDNSNL